MFNQLFGSHEITRNACCPESGHLGLRTGTAGTTVFIIREDLLNSNKEGISHEQSR